MEKPKSNLKDLLSKKPKQDVKQASKDENVIKEPSKRIQNIQFKGLSNSGNNLCYSNAVMQCLVSCKEFHSILEKTLKIIEEEEDFLDYPILFNLCKFLQFYRSKLKFKKR